MEEQSKPIINIWGEKVALGPIRRDMLPLFERWKNDFEVTLGIGQVRPFTAEQEEEWYERVSKSNDTIAFSIYELGPEGSETYLRPIGIAELMGIDYHHGDAEFGIMLGEKSAWGKGYGTEVARLLLDFGFNVLGLHNIWLRVLSFNEYAVKAYKRAGFREAGRLREQHKLGNKRYDDIYMDCLATEFEGSVIKKYLP
jgi:RimJ/RimL family protein N-acetyltransferase